ncbi:MAG TPA: acyl-ACP--UDP-N-acetylglucosamine O-acyltransferase, partial [Rubellimicrobium sp.]|nr:acyl-ACP--UDP-N-acetylglucosamine O-acyltransferase [Rubellimicrobium sp.]
GVVLKSHVVVQSDTEVGPGTIVFPFAVLGEIPQDLKYAGEPTSLRIGPRNRIREHVTMNLGTAGGGGVTRVGEGGLYMAGCHVAHDAQIGDRVVVANSAAIAGHCHIGDDVIIGGLAGIHQWVRVGQGAIIGALAMVTNDVIPYGLVQGPRGELDGLNLVGLKRRGTAREEIAALRAAYASLRDGEGPFQDRARALGASDSAMVRDLAEFVAASSDRQFLTPR